MPTDTRVYGYVRASTAMQADEGESLDVQQRQIVGHTLIHDSKSPACSSRAGSRDRSRSPSDR